MKRFLTVWLFIFAILSSALYSSNLWVDNFDDGSDPNLLGADNAYGVGGSDNGGGYYAFDYFKGGRSYYMDYGINTSANQYAYCVFPLVSSGTRDISTYSNICFWIKGKNGLEHLMFKIDDPDCMVDINSYVIISSSKWQKVVIPMGIFKYKGGMYGENGLKDLTAVSNFVISADKYYGEDFTESSAVYIDNLYLDTEISRLMYPIDTFENSGIVRNGVNGERGEVSVSGGWATNFIEEVGETEAIAGKNVYKFQYKLPTGETATLPFWLNHMSMPNAKYINFWAKVTNNTYLIDQTVNIEVNDSSGDNDKQVGNFYVTTNWKLFSMPIPSSIHETTNIVQVYITIWGQPTTNTMLIDNISLSAVSNRGDVPSAPTGLSVVSRSGGKIVIQWNANTEDDIEFYNIYRSSDNSSYKIIDTVNRDRTVYTDNYNISGYNSYYYKISAVDCEYPANESSLSGALESAPELTIPAAPTLSGLAGVGENSLWWTSISNAAQYKLFRSFNSGTGYSLIATINAPGTNYTDNNLETGISYYYMVKAVDSNGTNGLPSNEVELIPKDVNSYSGSDPFYLPTDSNIVKTDRVVFDTFDTPLIIGYNILNAKSLKLKVYDLAGNLIKSLKDKEFSKKVSDRDFIMWDGRDINNNDIGSGIYIIHCVTDTYTSIIKILVVR